METLIHSIRKQPHHIDCLQREWNSPRASTWKSEESKTSLLLRNSEKTFDTQSKASKSSAMVGLNFYKRRFRAEQGKSEEDFKKLTHSYVTWSPYFATSQLSNVIVFPLKFSTLIATNWSNSRWTLTSCRTNVLSNQKRKLQQPVSSTYSQLLNLSTDDHWPRQHSCRVLYALLNPPQTKD